MRAPSTTRTSLRLDSTTYDATSVAEWALVIRPPMFRHHLRASRSIEPRRWCRIVEKKSVRKAKRVDERRQRSGLLATAGVIQEIASEWLAPVFQNAHQSTTRQVRSGVLLQREPQAD